MKGAEKLLGKDQLSVIQGPSFRVKIYPVLARNTAAVTSGKWRYGIFTDSLKGICKYLLPLNPFMYNWVIFALKCVANISIMSKGISTQLYVEYVGVQC